MGGDLQVNAASRPASPPPGPPTGTEKKAVRRPFLLGVIGDIFTILSLFGWIRMGQGIAGWKVQVELLGRPVAVYLILSGAVWGLAGLLVGLVVWRRAKGAIPAIWAGAIFFPLAYWLERFVLVRSPEDWISWPFWLGLSIVWLLLVWVTLSRRSIRSYLGKEKPSP